MSTATLTDKDLRVRNAVMQQLEWDPAVDASAIGVSAREGAVALTGTINTYAGKIAAERAAKRVHGVRAVANDIEVTLALGRTDADIAADAATMLRLHNEVPESVQAAVHHGHVTLTGTVDWHYQRLQAEKVIRGIRGVRHVLDRRGGAMGGGQACIAASHRRISTPARRQAHRGDRDRQRRLRARQRAGGSASCRARRLRRARITFVDNKISSSRLTATCARSAEQGNRVPPPASAGHRSRHAGCGGGTRLRTPADPPTGSRSPSMCGLPLATIRFSIQRLKMP